MEPLRAAVPGAKLRMEELRESFGVSLSPLREALSRLVAQGFVVAESQRGFRAAPVSAENLREITALRLALERWETVQRNFHLTLLGTTRKGARGRTRR